jgi:pimeloyl-ACP methyl ester carboxylesterase
MEDSELVLLHSGRRVAVHTLATGSGDRTIVYCHPAPGAGNVDPNPEETAKRDVTLIALDRPGYGGSEMVTGETWASVAAAAEDIAEILQKRNIASVGVVGWSAGGRVALALAARHPERVDRVVVIATPAPEEAVPWIPPAQKQQLEALRNLPPEEVHARLAEQLAQMAPEDTDLSLLGRSPADDAALALPGAQDRLTRMMRAALAQGTVGMAADIAGYCLQPWGFTPAEVKAKTLLLYGSDDPGIASRHGGWWQKNLPQARLEMVPGAGHLVAIPLWGRVLSHLAPGSTQAKKATP